MSDGLKQHDPNPGAGLTWIAISLQAGPVETERTIRLTGPIERRELLADIDAAIDVAHTLREAIVLFDESQPKLRLERP